MFWLNKWDNLSKHWNFQTFRLCSCKSLFVVSYLFWSLTSFDLCVIACIPGCWQNDPRQQVWYEWQEGRLKGEGRGSKYTDTPSCPCLFVKKKYKNIYKMCSLVMMVSVKCLDISQLRQILIGNQFISEWCKIFCWEWIFWFLN